MKNHFLQKGKIYYIIKVLIIKSARMKFQSFYSLGHLINREYLVINDFFKCKHLYITIIINKLQKQEIS